VQGVDVDPSLVAGRSSTSTVVYPSTGPAVVDPVVLEVLPPDPATMDLAEAPSIVGGGASSRSKVMDQLCDVADRLGCSVGGTRVITDWGWLPFERQIGTTGVIVRPGSTWRSDRWRRPARQRARRPGPRHRREPRRQLPDDVDRRPGRGHRRPGPRGRTGPTAAARSSEVRTMPDPSVTSAETPHDGAVEPDFDVIVIGAGRRIDRGPGAGGRASGCACSSGDRSPARRTCTAASSTAASSTRSSRVVGGGAGAALGHPSRHIVMTETQALTVDYRTTSWGKYNMHDLPPDFDSWLADKAVEASAVLVTSTTATALL
jgi:hypothetical protein